MQLHKKTPFACSSALFSRSSVTPGSCSICFHSSGHGPERLHPWHKVSGGEISLPMSVWSRLVVQYNGPKSERVCLKKTVLVWDTLFQSSLFSIYRHGCSNLLFNTVWPPWCKTWAFLLKKNMSSWCGPRWTQRAWESFLFTRSTEYFLLYYYQGAMITISYRI